MENWQFLIQKQGDRSWYNLESPNLEISEGMYRVLARSHLRNTEVEIRVTHSSTQQVPSKRLIHKQFGRTDAQGLISVLPFTYLKPGSWELQCSADLMSDLLGQSWQYSMYLQVFFQQCTRVWSPGNTEKNIGSNLLLPQPNLSSITSLTDLRIATAMENTVINQSVSPVSLPGETAQQTVENFMAIGLNTTATVSEDDRVEDTLPRKPSLPLCLSLDQETYIAPWGETAVIQGQVQLQDQINWEGEKPPERLYALELLIELRSPTGSDIFTQLWQPLPDSTLPITISCAICLPVVCQSQLIVADINLYGALREFGEVLLLANQCFKITADPQKNLLNNSIHKEFAEQDKTTHPINSQLAIKDHGVQKNHNQESQVAIPEDLQVNAYPTHYSSPLIRKWIESQGYPFPELTPEV